MTEHLWLLWVDVPLAVLAALLWWSVSHMPPVPPLVDIQNSYRSYSTNKTAFNFWPEHFLVSQPSMMCASAAMMPLYTVARSSGIPVSTIYLGPDGKQQQF